MQRVAILGASGGVGSALARRLVSHGWSALLLGRDEGKLQTLATELRQDYARVDLSSSQPLEEILTSAAESSAGLTGVVNCVGSFMLKPAHATSDDDFRQMIETNLFSAFAAVRAGAKALRERGGSIVLFASAAAEIGIANHEAVAAAKAGVIGLARSAAATYAPQNVRINVVSPGLVKTNLTRRVWENATAATASIAMHALGRLGEPEQIASLVEWLLAAENDWVTGQAIGIDGGLGHLLPRKTGGST